ncbi:hypothetical protein JW868_00235 [Candidatus Woesearchaeota archaeon]|nr:hypothetical protein [Candidatus Woesearchaeota archaeon]
MRFQRGQVSVEHMITIAIAIFILIPGTALFYSYAKSSNEEVTQKQLTRIGNEIVNTAELVSALGENSRVVLKVSVPNSVQNLTIDQSEGTEIVFNYTTFSGNNEMMFYTFVNITSIYEPSITDEFHTGLVLIAFENIGDEVRITEQR